MIRRPRNVVILVLFILVGFHLILFVSQNYRVTIRTGDGGKATLNKDEENPSFSPTAPVRPPVSEEQTVQTLTEYEVEVKTNKEYENTSKETQPTTDYDEHGFQRPPDQKVEHFFGNDIIKDENNEFLVQKPYLKKGINPYDGRPELLPRSDVFRKFRNFHRFDNIHESHQRRWYNYNRLPWHDIHRPPWHDIRHNHPSHHSNFIGPPRQHHQNRGSGTRTLRSYFLSVWDEEGIKKYAAFGKPEKLYCDTDYCYVNERKIKKEIIKESPEDMFTFLPPKSEFMKEFRNPCWKGLDLENEEKLFCIPYFYIIGFTKCGTTDLFAILKNHTHVSSRAGKETHYFDRLRRGRIIRMNRKPTRLPVSFMSWTNAGKFRQNLLNTYRKDHGSDVLFHGITMDATPSAVWDNEFWEVFHPGYREPPVTNADVIATINPDTKIIISLRNPISRMQSAYQFFCAFHVYMCDRPVTPEKFHNLAAEAVQTFRDCQKTNTIRGCVYSTGTHQLATHLYASIYSVYLADWFKAFKKENIYVMMFEEHIHDEITSINNICDFLEISRFPLDYMKEYLEQHKVRNSLKDSARIPYILPETKKLLNDFFKPFLDDLVNMLGDKKWYWNIY